MSSSKVMSLKQIGVFTAVIAVAVLYAGRQKARLHLPDHLLSHPASYIPDMLTEKSGTDILDLIKEMKDFPCNTQDVKFYKTRHEHIGEGIPVNEQGLCDHPFMVPDNNRSTCVLPGRIDVGRHFAMHGGLIGLKERYEKIISRVQSFARFMFNPNDYPAIAGLFEQDQFLNSARAICPKEKQYLDPFQFNFIMQIPGQTVALHLDAPYFWGATRFQFPQWLLVVMVYSGLFKDSFVDQVQVVAYPHTWSDPEGKRAGSFVFWDNNEATPKSVPPTRLAGSAVDGSKTVHAAEVYMPDADIPIMDKSKSNILKYLGDDKWSVESDNETLREYVTDDIRMTIVYRARCFKDEAEKDRFNSLPEEETMQLDDILHTLSEELVRRGVVTSVEAALKMPRLDFSLLLMDTFIEYPRPPPERALIPYNYCALPRLLPWTSLLLKPFC